jgi:AcrR family transcriptional regulator
MFCRRCCLIIRVAPSNRFFEKRIVVIAKVAANEGEPMAEKRRRRTQTERSASTRETLLQATTKCLFERGYGATTTILVAEEAGVSRGAMLHQFPSKADLMTFVVEEVYAQEVALYQELLGHIDDPRERLVAYPEAAWKVLSRPEGVAVLEIFQGSRSDTTLAAKLAPVQAKIDARAKEALQGQFPRGVYVPLLQLIVGAARGLSVPQLVTHAGKDPLEAIKLLQEFLRLAIEARLFARLPAERPATPRPAKAKSK